MEQRFQYVALGKEGYPTVIMNQEQAQLSSYIYKKIKTSSSLFLQGNQKFTDKNFEIYNINLQELDEREYSWVRLDTLIQGNLFKELSYSIVDQKFEQKINFFRQIRLLPVDYYKTLFTNIIVNKQGIYKIILNVNGIFQYVEVDDHVPLHNNHSLWGTRFNASWEILLLKAYAKIMKGYKNVRNAEPFSFLKAVTFNNWRTKIFDAIDRKAHLQFLQHKLHGDITPNYLQQSNINAGVITVRSKIEQSIAYSSARNQINLSNTSLNVYKQNQPPSKFAQQPIVCSTKHSFTIISTTKDSQKLYELGLLPNSSCYRISQVFDIEGQDVLKVECSSKSKWNGRFSIYDPVLNKYYSEKIHRLSLDKNFLISLNDYRQLFSASLISPIDYQIQISSNHSYQTVTIPENCSDAQYFQFQIVSPGKYDFSIIQPQSNMIECNEQIHSFSKLKTSRAIYPKAKILIGRRNQIKAQISRLSQTLWDCVDASYILNPTFISTYFENLIAGRYMIRIKFEKCNKALNYTVDVVSDSPVKLYWVDPPKVEQSLFQRCCLLTLAKEKGSIFYLDSQTCQQWISYGNSYQEIGYSFVSFCAEQRSPYKLYCEINQQILKQEGFSLKSPYKNKGRQIGIFSESGEAKTIILKQKTNLGIWPPTSIRFFKVLP